MAGSLLDHDWSEIDDAWIDAAFRNAARGDDADDTWVDVLVDDDDVACDDDADDFPTHPGFRPMRSA